MRKPINSKLLAKVFFSILNRFGFRISVLIRTRIRNTICLANSNFCWTPARPHTLDHTRTRCVLFEA